MFMQYGQGFSLSPLKGEWFVHGQPQDWQDTDEYIFGIFNKNISVSANIPADTKLSLLMKAGDEVLYHAQNGASLGFQSYPAVWQDDAGSRPSGIDPDLIGLQFMETTIVVREKEYYDKKPPITITVKFEQGQATYTRTYKLNLTWDNYFSNKGNPLITDLHLLGVPFVAKYKDWEGWQPITGEYIYTCQSPLKSRVDFTGYWISCLSEDVEAKLDFPAFEPAKHNGGPYLNTQRILLVALDLCLVGLYAVVNNSGFPNGHFVRVQAAGELYYLLPNPKGTFIYEVPQENGNWHVFFIEETLTANEFAQLLGKKELWFYHEFQNDPLGKQRVRVGPHTFWEIMNISMPAPAFGGTSAGKLPISFLYGIMEFTARFPLWWMRLGTLPVLA